jgi:hypothetical protein
MDYSRLLLSPPLWFLAAALLIGAAASRATRRVRPRRGDRRAGSSAKWVLVCVYLTLAVVAATIGLLSPQAATFLTIGMLVACGVAAAVALPAFRFPRAVGGPVAVVAAAAVVGCALFLRAVVAFTGETEVATVRVLSHRDRHMTLELATKDGSPVVVEMDGEYFAPIVRVIVFDDALVFLGAKTWYRFDGLTAFVAERDGGAVRLKQAATGYSVPRPSDLSETLYEAFERLDNRIPGVKTVQIEMDLKRVESTSPGRELETYSIRVQNDGGVEVVRGR